MSQTKAQLVGGVGFSTADSLTVHNGLAITGVVTATSFSGSGAGLVGLANTDFINAEQVTVVGVVTASSAVLTGNISAASGTFTGNVTVGGTLTYDDVTNVDSIGLVTARSGIRFGLAGVGGSVSGTGNANFAGIVTATSLDASIAFWTLGASGSNHYTFTGPGDLSGDTDPDLQLIRGQKYIFKNRSGGHPFRIQSTPNGSAGTAYNDGVTNNDAGNGTDLIFDVPFDAPSILYYQCTSHGNMGGRIYIGSSSGDDVNVGAAVTIYASTGIVSATSYYGSGSNLTGINVAPSITATADGALADGDAVIVKSNGEVTKVVQTTTNNFSVEYNETLSTNITDGAVIDYPTSLNGFVIFYRTSGAAGRLRHMTLDAGIDDFHFGNEQDVTNNSISGVEGVYDANADKLLLSYKSGADTGVVKVVSFSDINTATFGSQTTYNNATTGDQPKICYDANAQKSVIFYTDGSNAKPLRAKVATISGTSVSFGTEATVSSNDIEQHYHDCVYDANAQKIVTAYVDKTNNYELRCKVGTISGTSISFGTEVTIQTVTSGVTSVDNIVLTYDSTNNKVVAFYRHDDKYIARVGTISGTSISFGTAVEIVSGNFERMGAGYDPDKDRHVMIYSESTGTEPTKGFMGTVSGTSISFGSVLTVNAEKQAFEPSIAYHAYRKRLIHFWSNNDQSNRMEFNAIQTADQTSNMTTGNFIGFSNGAYADNATATIQVVGAIDDAQTGLTTGAKHYVQKDGSLATTADTPSVEAGTAVSATKLIIKG